MKTVTDSDSELLKSLIIKVKTGLGGLSCLRSGQWVGGGAAYCI